MSTTDGHWDCNLPYGDGSIFIGADKFIDFAAVATLPAAPSAGLLYKTVGNAAASKFFVTLNEILRSGIYGTDQEQFGTAAAVTGPSHVSGTSGPLAFGPLSAKPPVLAANLATVIGSVAGPLPKGLQINSIDVIYQILGLAASAATIGLTTTDFPSGGASAPTVTNIIALGANGLPTAITSPAHPLPTNVAVATPAMIVPPYLNDRQVILNINLTGGASGTVNFYGVQLNVSYNYN